MPLAVLAAGGRYEWIELHDAEHKAETQVIIKNSPGLHLRD